MCHKSSLRLVVRAVHVDAGDLHGGEGLTMSIQLLVLFLAFEVEDEHLVAAAVFHDLAGDKSLRRLAQFACGRADGQHFLELDVVAAALGQLLDLNHVPGCDAILLSPGADHRVHGNASQSYRHTQSGAERSKLLMRLHLPEAGRRPSRGPSDPAAGMSLTGHW